ncbi:MAG: hypothetical protein AB7R89_29830 [Dehalococcoidia bacterium]
MDLKRLRQRCEARLQALDLPTSLNARSLCDTLVAWRGRPILLQPVANGAGPHGVWVAGPSVDVVFYERETSPMHQEHIILHELCHLLCDHRSTPVSDADYTQLLFPNLHPGTVQLLLQRAGYSTDEEREAEILASLILERTVGTPPIGVPSPDVEVGLVVRLEAALTGALARE